MTGTLVLSDLMDDVSLDAAVERLLLAFELDPAEHVVVMVTAWVHRNGQVQLLGAADDGQIQRIEGTLRPAGKLHQLQLEDGVTVNCSCAAGVHHGPS